MKILLSLLLPVILAAALPAGAVASPPREPSPAKCLHPAAWPEPWPKTEFPPPPSDDRGYDVRSYDLELDLDPATRTINGTVDIGLTALAAGKSRIRLDLVDDMTCDRVIFRGTDALFTHRGDSLEVVLPGPLATAFAETLTVAWHGQPRPHGNFLTGLMFRVHENGTPGEPADDVPVIANQNQPWSAHSWWPCKDHPADKALVSLAATVPDSLRLISNGSLLREDVPAPGRRRYAWREAYPIATYLVSLAATDYSSWSEDCVPGPGPLVPLEFHVFPQDRAKAEIDLAPTCHMMEMMVELAGPYPFAGEKYAQVEFKWFGSMEHQTATSLSPIVFTGDRFYELVVIHELAHQWFGDSLTPAVWADIWLNEGFARYAEALWLEHAYGPEAYRANLRLIGPERHPDLFAGAGILSDPDPILPNTLVYDKGAWVLHLLRMWIGDPAFFAFLHAYATDPDLVLGTVTEGDMIAHAEAAAGSDLSGFFRPWLDTSAVPVIRSEVTRRPPAEADHGVSITLSQVQTPLFQVVVPLEIHTRCGTIGEQIRLDRADRTLTLATDCRVDSVSIDPDGLVLMRTGTAPPPALEVVGPRPNPVRGSGGRFNIYLTDDREVVVKIYDVRGRLIQSRDLGFLAATGPRDDPDSLPHPWTWPAAGAAPPAPDGVYWAEFTAGGARAVRKLALLK